MTDELPAGVTVVSATPGCTTAGTTVTCAVGTVASGASATVTVTVAIPPGSDASSLVNVASVSSSTADLDPDDNSAGAAVAVERRADLAVTKTATPATVVPGQTTTYTVTVRNDGPSDAVNVLATDTVSDPNLELVSAAAPGATCSVTGECLPVRGAPVGPRRGRSTMTVVGRLSPDAPGGARHPQHGDGDVRHQRRRRRRQHRDVVDHHRGAAGRHRHHQDVGRRRGRRAGDLHA